MRLGFSPVARVEKFRTYYKHPSLDVTMDEYPFIGSFLEVEGAEEEVLAFCSAQGQDMAQATQQNCTEAFLAHAKEIGLQFPGDPRLHFTFEDEKGMKKE